MTWSTIDLVFLSDDLSSAVTRCAATDMYGSDHKSIELILDLHLVCNDFVPRPMYRATDWEGYAEHLKGRLEEAAAAWTLHTTESIDGAVTELTGHIQKTLERHTPMSKPSHYAKRWWSPELTELRPEHKHASRKASARNATDTDRADAVAKQRRYFAVIRRQKRRHWREWLEDADMHSVWLANKVVSAPANGGVAETAEEKWLETFFPTPPPADTSDIPNTKPMPLEDVNEAEVEKIIDDLSPFKAPGISSIPNVAIQKAKRVLAPIIVRLANACFRSGYHPNL
ncbi:hypothetical protein R3P38DRAFT_3334134 [Favolaschia claudopus]|uniref:Endonuclease/exonuclease/phosphatase domain-containing protein n=1 Tax=Favolaschia claudopus TaxID=2862362 RepID=A0AAV9ZEV0_9AGAR